MKNYLKLMRVKHYLKNGLIFLPLFFNGSLLVGENLFKCILAFICFSLTSSIVYIINDIQDCEKDRLHEIKKMRPIASGAVSKKEAYLLVSVNVIVVAMIYLIFLSNEVLSSLWLLLYLVLNIGYSMGWKHIPLLDIAILVSGFVIRVIFGASVMNVEVSGWLYLTVLSASFYMGLGKRRNEIIKNGTSSRKVLQYYSQDFLDKNMYMCMAITIVFYSLWAMEKASYFILTIPLVILILMKYSMEIESDNYGDPVEIITHSKVLLFLGVVLATILMGLLYFGSAL